MFDNVNFKEVSTVTVHGIIGSESAVRVFVFMIDGRQPFEQDFSSIEEVMPFITSASQTYSFPCYIFGQYGIKRIIL